MNETQFPDLEMVTVAGAEFIMGDDNAPYPFEKPAHKVWLNDFRIAKFPVTQALWKAMMGLDKKFGKFSDDRCPIDTVSWYEAGAFDANVKINGRIETVVPNKKISI